MHSQYSQSMKWRMRRIEKTLNKDRTYTQHGSYAHNPDCTPYVDFLLLINLLIIEFPNDEWYTDKVNYNRVVLERKEMSTKCVYSTITRTITLQMYMWVGKCILA